MWLIAAGNGVTPCGDDKYCCYNTTGCDCNNSTIVFTLAPFLYASRPPTSTSSIPPTIATTSAITHSSSTRSSPSTQATSPAAPNTYNNNNNNNLGLGLGTGLGLGIPLLLAVMGAFWFLSRRRSGIFQGVTRSPSLAEVPRADFAEYKAARRVTLAQELEGSQPPVELR